MKMEVGEEMREFIVRHFEKRIAYRKKHMPQYINDPWLQFANGEDEKSHRESVDADKRKTLEFIEKAERVIETFSAK